MDIEGYLRSVLSVYPIPRIKVRAEIELQHLVDDKLLYVGDAYYLRDLDGKRIGVVCEYQESKAASEVVRIEIICQHR